MAKLGTFSQPCLTIVNCELWNDLKKFHPPTKMGNICVAQKMAIFEKAKYAQSVVFNPLILKVDIQSFNLEFFLTLKN